MDVFISKVHYRPINGKYALTEIIGKGGFGRVYLARDIVNNNDVALKLEHRSIDPSYLEDEARTYEAIQDAAGFPQLYWFGNHDDYRVMAFELLGPSLEDLHAYCDYRFSPKTTLMITNQILIRLEELHSRAVIHRDIKPQNFLLGTGRNGGVIYVTDFGLADEHIERNDNAVGETLQRSRLVGTARFASIRGHQGQAQDPMDDLESLAYMMVYFLQGTLPWQGLKADAREEKHCAVLKKKMSTTAARLCQGLPYEVFQFVQEVKASQARHRPDYEQLRRNLRRLADKEGWKYDNVFDWTARAYLETKSTTHKRSSLCVE